MNKQEQVMMRFRDVYDKRAWLDKLKMEVRLKGYQSSEVHCLELIGKTEGPNVTKLADFFYMTRGAMSKVTKKLMEKGMIESYQKPENKKEIYFRLTEKGRAVYEIHEGLHKEFRERDQAVFEQVPEEQFDSMLVFLERYNQHLDAEIKKLNLKGEA